MKFTESMIKEYAEPISTTEEQKCKNAINMVRDALKSSNFTDDDKEVAKLYEGTLSFSLEMRNKLNNRKIKMFVQGSYANGTNVKMNSDVDIAIILESVFKTKYRYGMSDSSYGFSNVNYGFKEFKDDVQLALTKSFGSDVIRGDKSIKINGNSYRTYTDTVPALRYRDYSNEIYGNADNYIGAIYIFSDDGKEIVNYPEQHIVNGKEKNNNTNYYYKKMVRIIKKIRYIMEDNKILSASKVSSFGLESLLWNIPDSIFTKYSIYRFEFEEILKYLVENEYKYSIYKEANNIKDLFSDERNIDDYKKFIHDLQNFYQYDIKES